ncbi:hypothetical protein Mapa_007755 [Marchantia paleacea]|nr:hypothetical protein Mapa_007755 [Marchantia paleacea]
MDSLIDYSRLEDRARKMSWGGVPKHKSKSRPDEDGRSFHMADVCSYGLSKLVSWSWKLK